MDGDTKDIDEDGDNDEDVEECYAVKEDNEYDVNNKEGVN